MEIWNRSTRYISKSIFKGTRSAKSQTKRNRRPDATQGATGRRQLYTDIITRDLAALNQRSIDHFLMNAFVSSSASLLPSSIDDLLDVAFSH